MLEAVVGSAGLPATSPRLWPPLEFGTLAHAETSTELVVGHNVPVSRGNGLPGTIINFDNFQDR